MAPEQENGLRKRRSQNRLSADNNRLTKKTFTRTFLDPNVSNCLAGGPPRTTYASAEGVVRVGMQGDEKAGGPEEHGTANGGSDTSMDGVDEAANWQNRTSIIEADEDEAGEHDDTSMIEADEDEAGDKCKLPLPGRVRNRPYVKKEVRQKGNRCCECRKIDCICGHKALIEGCYWCIGS
ncbi:MAG: hypothetical protein M1839_004363 [Geoglossum umbratile]|nr:MAG: hypothetical protein M1839_004363 [Geoglossum umbratile]